MIGEAELSRELKRVEFWAEIYQKASMLLTLMQKPAFLVSLLTIDKFREILIQPTVALQSKYEFNILEAYLLMNSVIKVGRLKWEFIENYQN